MRAQSFPPAREREREGETGLVPDVSSQEGEFCNLDLHIYDVVLQAILTP